ncbi:MAG: rhomboid family intramembrane serine protease [Vicinamibacterales bacterium]
MLGRKTSGSVVCPSCGSLVGVNDERCYSCGRVNPGMWGFAPLLRQFGNDLGLVPLVIGVCSALFLVSVLLTIKDGGSAVQAMWGLSSRVLNELGATGSYQVLYAGAWWTLLSASWLHGGLLHLVMNMMALRNLGPGTADLIGPSRTAIIYVIAGVCGFLLSVVMGAGTTIGASASICGLIGALIHYGRRSGSSLIYNQALQWAIATLVLGFIVPAINNWAHLGGFIGGYLASAVLNPLTRERGDHMLGAAICLLVSFAAVAYSIVDNWLLIIN